MKIQTTSSVLLAAALAVVGCQPVDHPRVTPMPGPGTGSVPTMYPTTQQSNSVEPDADDAVQGSDPRIITKPLVLKGPFDDGFGPPTTRPGKTASPAPAVAGGNTPGTVKPTNPAPGVTPAVVSPSAPDVPMPKVSLADLRRVDSSASALPLVHLLAMRVSNIPTAKFSGFGMVDFVPDVKELDDQSTEIANRESSGTTAAIARLVKGEVDLVLSTREPSPEEQALAGRDGGRLAAVPLGMQALVFTVNRQNPVTDISIDRLQGIFSGKLHNWKDIENAAISQTNPLINKPITVAYRFKGTGTEELMQQVLMAGQPLAELPVSNALNSTKLVLDAAAEDPETIGFGSYGYGAGSATSPDLKLLSVAGVKPDAERVAAGAYPLSTPLYLVSRQEMSADSSTGKLRAWLLSPAGQKLVAEAGYAPLTK